jgi:hypothetical protein
MITLKAGEEAIDIGQYRDLWLVPHGQKLVMSMLKGEYVRATGWVVGSAWLVGRKGGK